MGDTGKGGKGKGAAGNKTADEATGSNDKAAKAPRTTLAPKPALSRRGHVKRPHPHEDAVRRLAAENPGVIEEPPEGLIWRDERGRFQKGRPSPNPRGAGAAKAPQAPRMFGMSQTIKDVLELLDQPVSIRKGKVRREVPAIVAIYDRMIHMAIGGDWNAIKKCVELREKYSESREQTLGNLITAAQACRDRYAEAGEEMPDHVRELVELSELRAQEGQFEAG